MGEFVSVFISLIDDMQAFLLITFLFLTAFAYSFFVDVRSVLPTITFALALALALSLALTLSLSPSPLPCQVPSNWYECVRRGRHHDTIQ